MNIKPIKNIKPINFDDILKYSNENQLMDSLDFTITRAKLDDYVESINLEKNLEIENKIQKYIVDELGNVTLVESNPVLLEKMNELQKLCEEEGIYIKITEVIRSVERQNELYSKGRTSEGNIVTNAKGNDYASMHQWGIAFDVCINEINNPYDYDKLQRVGEIGRSIGLEWGGDWENFKDMPHFQLPNYSIEELKLEYDNPGSFSESW